MDRCRSGRNDKLSGVAIEQFTMEHFKSSKAPEPAVLEVFPRLLSGFLDHFEFAIFIGAQQVETELPGSLFELHNCSTANLELARRAASCRSIGSGRGRDVIKTENAGLVTVIFMSQSRGKDLDSPSPHLSYQTIENRVKTARAERLSVRPGNIQFKNEYKNDYAVEHKGPSEILVLAKDQEQRFGTLSLFYRQKFCCHRRRVACVITESIIIEMIESTAPSCFITVAEGNSKQLPKFKWTCINIGNALVATARVNHLEMMGESTKLLAEGLTIE
ncbi:hypothetical protein EV368DRAFT_65927 [Lentinula lateritia]|nr:hypothetical protein EV368DRAFT_65927 [Lentinula lateritia]